MTNPQTPQVTDAMIEAGVDTYSRMLGNYTIQEIVSEIYLAMRALEPQGDEDAVDEALRAFHYETFRAGVCYERDEWPLNSEEWADLDRGIQSEAVGEHYEGWASETIDKLTAALGKSKLPGEAESYQLARNYGTSKRPVGPTIEGKK